MLFVMLLLSAAGLGLQAAGQISQGRAAKKAAESQAAAAELTAKQQEYNAGVADAQARDAEDRGEDMAARLRDQVRGLVGSQRSGFAAQGVVVNNGSAAAVQQDARALAEIDVRAVRADAQRQAWGFRVDAENSRRNAAVARQGGVVALREGNAAAKASYVGAGATIVGGTGSILMQRYGWRQPTSSYSSSTSARSTGGRGVQPAPA